MRAQTVDSATRFTTVSHRKKAARTSTCASAALNAQQNVLLRPQEQTLVPLWN